VRALFRAIGHYPTRIAGERFRGDPHHIGFWRLVGQGRWEPRTLEILRQFLTPSSIYVDVGAWIGPLALYAARRARRVYCIEPDYVAYQHLLENIRLNHAVNVLPFNLALAAERGIRRMAPVEGRLGSTHTSMIVPGNPMEAIDVCCLRWKDWLELAGMPRVDLLKIDIEGGEFELLPSMREYLEAEKPTLCLSLHAPLLPAGARAAAVGRILETLAGYGKRLDESGRPISPDGILAASAAGYTSYLLAA
jgi:FkbM family methyltransferase